MMSQQRRPRALFGNANFTDVAGSELVILEMAEALCQQGWECEIVAWLAGDPMTKLARKSGIKVRTDINAVQPLTYDLVWLNNRLEAVFDFSLSAEDAPQTLFAFGHLDRRWSYAQVGVILERLVGEKFIVTSEEGVDRLAEANINRALIHIFRNAAPGGFRQKPPAAKASPNIVFVVSNHAPAEVLDAAIHLKENGIDVEHWGAGGDHVDKRLLPKDLARADAVLTIGKTVPYAIRSGRPAFIYDHFGGPGWLRRENFAAAARRNFSGLCAPRKLSGREIAEELTSGYAAAADDARSFGPDIIKSFELELFVMQILEWVKVAPSPTEIRSRFIGQEAILESECHLAQTAGHYFRAFNRKPKAPKPSL